MIFIHRNAKLGAGVLVAALCLAPLSPTEARAAEARDLTQLTVEHIDLNLGSSQGANELYVRLETAARTECARALAATAQSDELQSCEQRAIEHAVRIFDLPLLTAVYDRHFPGEPLPAALSLSYAARDNASGYMAARMPDGEAYSGEYLEPRQYVHIDPSDPFWSQWCKDEGGARDSDCQDTVGAKPIEYARNEVLAGLKDAAGESMHCRLALSQPSSGIEGGAEGECMLPAGEAVHVQIPHA
jgi:UrcA family protein